MDNVTFEHLFNLMTPILIGIIGTLIVMAVRNIKETIIRLELRFDRHVSRIEKLIDDANKTHSNFDLRISKLEILEESRE